MVCTENCYNIFGYCCFSLGRIDKFYTMVEYLLCKFRKNMEDMFQTFQVNNQVFFLK